MPLISAAVTCKIDVRMMLHEVDSMAVTGKFDVREASGEPTTLKKPAFRGCFFFSGAVTMLLWLRGHHRSLTRWVIRLCGCAVSSAASESEWAFRCLGCDVSAFCVPWCGSSGTAC